MVGQSFTLALDFVVARVPRAVIKWKRGKPPHEPVQMYIYIGPIREIPRKKT